VGGDDFFAAFKATDADAVAVHERIAAIIDKFSHDVASLYDPGDRNRGYIEAVDREGRQRRFSLLSVSAAVLEIPAGRKTVTLEEIGVVIAELKKRAKGSEKKIAYHVLEQERPCRPVARLPEGLPSR
jgi:hypothetical protein